MHVRARHARIVLLVVVLAALWARPAVAGPPTDELRQRVDRVLVLLQDASLTQERRRTEIRKVATEIFDFPETARRSLGPHWNQRTPEQREEFVRLFTDLLERAYLAKIEQYGGERVTYMGDAVEADVAVVRTKIVTRQGTDLPVDYRMMRQSQGWRVYDVIIEGVSLISNHRTQFNRIIQTASYDELLARLRARSVPLPPASRGGTTP